MSPSELDDALSQYDAEQDWRRARRKALYQEVVCFFKECSVDLLSFEDVRAGLHLRQKIERGLQEIPLARIRGSVGRYDDFTSAFLPRKKHMQQRWEGVDRAVMTGDVPPIEVYQVGESYFVLDGNHRVSIARQHNQETIDAFVWEYPAPADLGPDADINEFLLHRDKVEFLARIGPGAPPVVREIVLTCPDCYGDLVDMIETYRHGVEKAAGSPVSTEEAVAAWYEEVYEPAIVKIRKNNLLARFPGRTEADLFIWSWKNNKDLEEIVLGEESLPGE